MCACVRACMRVCVHSCVYFITSLKRHAIINKVRLPALSPADFFFVMGILASENVLAYEICMLINYATRSSLVQRVDLPFPFCYFAVILVSRHQPQITATILLHSIITTFCRTKHVVIATSSCSSLCKTH